MIVLSGYAAVPRFCMAYISTYECRVSGRWVFFYRFCRRASVCHAYKCPYQGSRGSSIFGSHAYKFHHPYTFCNRTAVCRADIFLDQCIVCSNTFGVHADTWPCRHSLCSNTFLAHADRWRIRHRFCRLPCVCHDGTCLPHHSYCSNTFGGHEGISFGLCVGPLELCSQRRPSDPLVATHPEGIVVFVSFF